jgi:dihydroorotate dehydrogenase
MSWVYRNLLRPVLFAREPEEIHHRTLRGLAWVSRHEATIGLVNSIFGGPALPHELFGLRFPNPIGLAAGMDKFAEAVPAWEALGFGFAELGAVTWQPQSGNPEPRLFRVVSEQAIINRMGFNNPGAEIFAESVACWRDSGRWPAHPVGVNLGKSKITPLEEAPRDYADSYRVLAPLLDFFVVNVSSPNTPNLRQLQDKTALDEILTAIQAEPLRKPLLVKVAPDLSFEALDEILELSMKRKIAGIIATNTTITRPASKVTAISRLYGESGGLSGRPLRARSTEVVAHLYGQSRGALPIIGVGGIFTADDAWDKITAGAALLQIYTSLVYEGPGIIKRILKGLQMKLAENGLSSIQEAIGKTELCRAN